MERFTEYHCGVAVIKDKNLLKEAMAKLAAYEDAEEEGRLVVLPCKVGDTVYIIQKIYTKCLYGQEFDESSCCGCEAEECDSKKKFVVISRKVYDLVYCVEIIPKIGKTVFTTREEAEKALEALTTR